MQKEESEISIKEINHEINETYYHRLDDTSKFDEPTCGNISKKKKVARVLCSARPARKERRWSLG